MRGSRLPSAHAHVWTQASLAKEMTWSRADLTRRLRFVQQHVGQATQERLGVLMYSHIRRRTFQVAALALVGWLLVSGATGVKAQPTAEHPEKSGYRQRMDAALASLGPGKPEANDEQRPRDQSVPTPVLLKAGDWITRRTAVEAIGESGDTRAFDLLYPALADESAFVRESAAKALGNLGDKRAVPVLLIALKDKGSLVRCATAQALGKLGGPNRVHCLQNDPGTWFTGGRVRGRKERRPCLGRKRVPWKSG